MKTTRMMMYSFVISLLIPGGLTFAKAPDLFELSDNGGILQQFAQNAPPAQAGHAVANAPSGSSIAPEPLNSQAIMAMQRTQIEELFKSHQPGVIPDGESNGRGNPQPGTEFGGGIENIVAEIWKGKVFKRIDANHAELINKIGSGHLFKAKVYYGDSWLQPGTKAIIIDYRGTVVGFIRDEIRQVGPSLYVGFAFLTDLENSGPIREIPPPIFVLQFPKPQK